MKRLLALILCLSAIFCLFVSCGDEDATYDPVPSTEEESAAVMFLSIDGETYTVKYELYRALFLSLKSDIDGGDDSVWRGEDKEKYASLADTLIAEKAATIYSAFAVCKKIGFDVYSDNVDEEIKKLVKMSVEGGSWNGQTVEGYGSYEEYLAALKRLNMNYSVQELLYRYAIAINAIDEYYIGTVFAEDIDGDDVKKGALEYTEDDVREFYFSDECVRVLRMYIQASYDKNPEERLERVRNALVNAAYYGERAVGEAMIGNGSMTAEEEVMAGYVMAKHNLDASTYKDLTDAAFKLKYSEVSEAIKIIEDGEVVYYFLYRTSKDEGYLEDNMGSVTYVYLRNEVGRILDEAANELLTDVATTELLKSLDRSKISME